MTVSGPGGTWVKKPNGYYKFVPEGYPMPTDTTTPTDQTHTWDEVAAHAQQMHVYTQTIQDLATLHPHTGFGTGGKKDMPKKFPKIDDQYLLKGDDARYTTTQDVVMRLKNTIVRFEGIPYLIKDPIGQDLIVAAWDLYEGHDDEYLDPNDSRLDISSIPLGYMNISGGHAMYPMRLALQSQKQGICINNLSWFSANKGQTVPFHTSTEVYAAFRQMYARQYPALEDAIKEKKSAMAFARSWALAPTKDPDIRVVYHRNYAVAYFLVSENRFVFPKEKLTRFRHDSLTASLFKQSNPGVNYAIEATF